MPPAERLSALEGTAFSALDRGRLVSRSYPGYIRMAVACCRMLSRASSAVFSTLRSTGSGTACFLIKLRSEKLPTQWCVLPLIFISHMPTGANHPKSYSQGRHGGSSLPPGSFIATADSQINSSNTVCYPMPRSLQHQSGNELILHRL
jgi:hypothetical protein